RARWSRIAMAGCLVLAGLLALLLLDQQRRRQDAWILVHDMQPQDWRHATLAGPYGQRPLPPHQRPDAEHLYIDNEDVISLPEWDSSGEVRISCEISWPGHVSAFDIIARAQLAQSYHTKHAPAGLLARVGGPDRLCLLDLRAEPYQPHGRWSARMHLLPDVRHHIELEILQHRLRLSVDGTILIDELMLIPELAADWGGLALRSHGPCQVHSLRLQRRQLAESSGPLTVADGLLGNGDLRAAYDSYRHIASRYTGTIRERALARGIGVGARIDFDDVTTLQRLQTRLHREFPHSRWLQEADEAICLAYWRHGHHTEALARADALLQRWPASDVAVSITSLPHQPLLPAIAEDLMGIIGRSPSIHQLDLSHYQLRDISDLAAHRLVSLQLSGNQITDLAPLHGQPLHELGLNGNPVQDLSPMRGAPLARLMATNTPLKSLAPLADCPQLRYLDCSDAAVQDLTPLRALQRLRILKLRRTAISDLEPLTALPLVELRLDGCAISDLSAVAGMPLEHLSISDCPVTDLGPLARLPLRRLAMDRCPVADLAELPLQGLQRFSGRDLRLPDLAALSAAPLRALTLDGNRIDDPSRLLAALPQLQQLSLRRCRLPTQLELPAAHLHLLDLAETGMQHLRLHPDSRIESLDLSGNGPLAVHLPEQLGLHELLLDGTMLERALLPTELPELRVLQIDQHSMTQAQAGQLHRLLLQGEHHPDLLASLRLSMSLAWPNGDYPAQALYQHHTGLYLDTGRVLDQTAAETLAARLHAHLPAAGLPPGLLRALVLPNTRIMAGGGLLHDTNHAGYLRPAAPWEGGRTILFWPASATAP
ncbi:MAG: leucine-rich repeat domain-containing protein, partial [Planctomycetota bacterium]